MIRVRKVMRFSQHLSENNSFLQTENPKCYTDTAVAEALQPITKREEFSMSQKKRKPNEFTIGYKAMVTDYLLYEDCCDYHLKLILAVWDGVTVQEEVKYFSYLTTWGSNQFRDLCVDFGLLACARSVYCDLNRLLGAYCIVQYYPKKHQMPEDKIDEVMPVVSDRDRENNWDHLQFAEPFARIAVAEEKAESTIPLAKYVDDIEETYWFCIDHLWLHPNIRCIYRKNLPELPIPRHPEHDKKWISMRKRDFPEHNLYVPVKEYDLRMEHDAESYYGKEPLRRNR